MPKKYIVETDKGKFVVEVADATSDAKPIDPNETDNPVLAGIKGFGQGVVDQFKGYGKFNKDNKDPFSFKGSSPGVEKFMQTPLAKPTGVETIDNLLSPYALSTLGMVAARPVLETPLNRGTAIKGLRAVSEPLNVWKKITTGAADYLERGVTEPKRSMSDVYSEKPAPPRDPNAPAPRVEPTKISDVVKPSKGATPYEMPKPAEGRISDVVKEVPGAQPYDMPQEGVTRSPADGRSGKVGRAMEQNQGADDLGEMLDRIYGTSEADPVPSINTEGHGPPAKSSFVDTMKSTEPEFTRDVHTGAEEGTPEAKSAQAHHKAFGEMDADYRRSIDDPLRSILVALLGGGGAASLSKEPE